MRDIDFLERMKLCEWASESAELHRGDLVAAPDGSRCRVLAFDARNSMALVAGGGAARRLPSSSLERVGREE